MKKKKNNPASANPLQGFRMTGMITFQETPYEVLLSKKGDIAFARQGKWIEDPVLQNQLMEYLLQANQENSAD